MTDFPPLDDETYDTLIHDALQWLARNIDTPQTAFVREAFEAASPAERWSALYNAAGGMGRDRMGVSTIIAEQAAERLLREHGLEVDHRKQDRRS